MHNNNYWACKKGWGKSETKHIIIVYEFEIVEFELLMHILYSTS